MMDYGTDFLLVDDDVVFTAEGDIEIVSGPRCVAQDIDQTLKLTPGRLRWDNEAGSSLWYMLNDSGSNPTDVIAELERVAIEDRRVDPASVRAVQTGPKQFRLQFTPLGAVEPKTLDYDLTKGAAS
jgi:hypothetical protein